MRADVMRLRGTNNFRASRPLVTTMVSPRRCTGTGLYSLAGLIIQQHGAPGSNPGMSINFRGCVASRIGEKPSTPIIFPHKPCVGAASCWSPDRPVTPPSGARALAAGMKDLGGRRWCKSIRSSGSPWCKEAALKCPQEKGTRC